MIETLQSHYGFTVLPFTAAIPVPALFGSAAHKEALARLRWLISARGLGVITGEVGSGKTAAVRAAVAGLDPSRHTLIYLPNPQIAVRGIHGAVAAALGQAPRFHHATLIPQVEAALAAEADERNRHVVLAIDESHLLTSDQLEAVRMLTNHDLDSRSPLTILLIGQPTLRRRLRVGDMAALDQRVALRYHIPAPALTPAEASGYIRRHLEHAGRSDTLFSDDAVRAIHAHARGLPHAINRLAVTALLAACAAGKTIADESSARAAISEEAATAPPRPPPAPPGPRPAGLFTPARRHAQRRRNRHPERRLTPAVSPGQAPRDHRPERAASPRCLTPCQPVSPSSWTGPLSCHMFYYSIRNAKALPHRERALSCENSSGGGI